MSGEISQITAPLSGNSKDFYWWLQFCQRLRWTCAVSVQKINTN